ncbi:hypothetical protein LSAT2_029955 [Lamellibrachia satsuma]|nr:hypothetical protein LSAT2_029955 [Lamellibrachia satsuma]
MSAKEKTLVVAGVTAGVVVTGVAAAVVTGAAASTTTAAASTTGGATVVASGGANVADISGKAGSSTASSVMRKWNKGVGKRGGLDDEEENEESTSEISVIDSLDAQVKALMIAEDDKPTSGK